MPGQKNAGAVSGPLDASRDGHSMSAAVENLNTAAAAARTGLGAFGPTSTGVIRQPDAEEQLPDSASTCSDRSGGGRCVGKRAIVGVFACGILLARREQVGLYASQGIRAALPVR